MEKILLNAAQDGRFDVVLLAYNFLKEDQSDRIERDSTRPNSFRQTFLLESI